VAKQPPALEKRVALAIAERVRSHRIAAALSQEELGELAGIHRTYIGAIERGEKNVTVLTLARLAAALRCDLAELVPGDADAHQSKRRHSS
jgi:transcriptional regulator with XRE-family HTH domain